MNFGQSNISFQSNAIAAPIVPGSARNGLSLDGSGKIVWGNDVGAPGSPAQLLNSREVDFAGNDFAFIGNNINALFSDGAGGILLEYGSLLSLDIGAAAPARISMATIGGASGFFADHGSQESTIGDLAEDVTGLQMLVGGGSGSARVFTKLGATTHNFLNLVSSSFFFGLGDLSTAQNGTKLEIDDTLQTVNIGQGVTALGLQCDFANRIFSFGDLFSVGNTSNITIADIQRRITATTQGADLLALDLQSDTYGIGDVAGAGATGIGLFLDGPLNFAMFDNIAHNLRLGINGSVGASGNFTTVDLKTVTVDGGLIVSIV